MNTYVTRLSYRLLHQCQRFLSTNIECSATTKWTEPVGYKTDLTIYNSNVKSFTPLVLKTKDILRWYACGPTVYDSAHIGHAVTYVKSDIIRRIISDFFNINVVTAMCITDIDDKIIKRAKEEGKSVQELTKYYETEFLEDMKSLNVLPPNMCYRVTDCVTEIISFVEQILNKDFAYIGNDGSVFFDTIKFVHHRKILQPLRGPINPYKKNQTDFTLWKAAKEGEPYYQAPWGIGRPGWHIECSTIASLIFGKSVDLHSGGRDLIFPHHTNEEIQSCCYHNVEQWVNYWMHFGHLHLKGDQKMSKSLKNTISIQDFLKKHTANEFRMLCLLSSYGKDLLFSDECMNQAVTTLHTINNCISDCNNYLQGQIDECDIDELLLLEYLDETQTTVKKMLANDFNTAQAMHAILRLVKIGHKMFNSKSDLTKARSSTAVAAVSNYLSTIMTKFGFSKTGLDSNIHLNKVMNELLTFRHAIRKKALESGTKDKALLAECDRLRLGLSTHGIKIKDTKSGPVWVTKEY